MNDQEKSNSPCPGCGYPAHAGHGSGCVYGKAGNVENPYSNDYSSVPPEMKKFIVPHAAEGPNTHLLSVKESGFEMPVSFHVEGRNFYITGVEDKSGVGGIIWGNSAGDAVKIKHIDLAKSFRGTGAGKALLNDLEGQLQNQGIKTVYSGFYKKGTVEFFQKNGYHIVPLSSVSEEQRQALEMESEDYDNRVANDEDFARLKADPENQFRKILLVKEIKS